MGKRSVHVKHVAVVVFASMGHGRYDVLIVMVQTYAHLMVIHTFLAVEPMETPSIMPSALTAFANLFTGDPKVLTIKMKSKELQVVAHKASTHDGFTHDQPLYLDLDGGCCANIWRLDVRKRFNNNLLYIEIDEGQKEA